MAINVNLAQLSTLNNQSILTQSNSNFSTIQTSLVDSLSRSGQSPNQMTGNLDMNNSQILNLPPPATINSPARLVDVTSPATISSVPPVGTSGAVVPLLNGNNTWSGTNTFNNTVSVPFTQTGTGAVARTVDAKLKDVISVKDFGAAGNGTTDDTTSIQTAINAAEAAVSFPAVPLLYFPAGTYKVTSTLNFGITTQPFNIKGEGSGSSVINFVPTVNSTCFNFNFSINSEPLFIHGLYFQTSNAHNNIALNLTNSNEMTIQNCSFNNWSIGAMFTNSFGSTFINCIFTNCFTEGINFTDSSGNRASIIDNTFANCGNVNSGPAIFFNSTSTANQTIAAWIAGNDFEGCFSAIGMNNVSGFSIIGNDFDHENSNHFYFTGGTNTAIDIRGNNFGACPSVTIASITGITFENNHLFNYSQSWDSTTATLVKVGYNSFDGTGSCTAFGNALFSSLPTASSSLEGRTYPVTDSTTASFRATITGGGANHVLAYCNGTNWTVAG